MAVYGVRVECTRPKSTRISGLTKSSDLVQISGGLPGFAGKSGKLTVRAKFRSLPAAYGRVANSRLANTFPDLPADPGRGILIVDLTG